VAQAVEHLPGRHEALSSDSNTPKTKTKTKTNKKPTDYLIELTY
jgi:hypothetical protein